MPVFRQQDGLVPSSAVENNNHPPPAPSAPLPSLAEPRVERVQSPVTEPPAARPTESEYLLGSGCLIFFYLCIKVELFIVY